MLLNRSLLGLFTAEIVSLTGSAMTVLALPWFVLATTGSTARMGWVLAARMAPLAFFGIPSGTLIARVGAKRTLLISDAARGPLLGIIPFLYWTGHLSFPLLLAAAFAMGSFTAPYGASSALVVPEVVGDDERLVARAGAIVGTSQQFTQIFGPVLAGIVIALTSPATVLVVDGCTFLFSFVTIALTVRGGRRVPETAESRGVFAGVRYVARDALLGPLVVAACLLNAVVQGLVVGLNTLAFFHYGNAHVAGFLFGSLGVGALIGAVVAQQLTKRVDLLKLSALAIVAMPFPLWLLSIEMPWAAAMFVIGAFAFFMPIVNSPLIGVFTVRTPAELRPKAMTALITLSGVAGPLGYVAGGFALAHVSVYLVFFVIAALLTVTATACAAVLLRNRAATDLVAVPDIAHG